jgi:hypothetical protein
MSGDELRIVPSAATVISQSVSGNGCKQVARKEALIIRDPAHALCKAISDRTLATQPISSSLKRTGMIPRSAIVSSAPF